MLLLARDRDLLEVAAESGLEDRHFRDNALRRIYRSLRVSGVGELALTDEVAQLWRELQEDETEVVHPREAFEETVRRITGYQHIIPTHQGRAAEHIMSQVMIRDGQSVPGNMYFTTTKLHQEMAGGVFLDVIVDEAHDPESPFPWKGNIDLGKLQRLIAEHGHGPRKQQTRYLR